MVIDVRISSPDPITNADCDMRSVPMIGKRLSQQQQKNEKKKKEGTDC